MTHSTRADLMKKLDELGIQSTTVDHPEVFTVEAMMPHLEGIPGAVSKNLFLKDKKKKLWLLSCLHDREVKLNEVAKKVGAPGGLRLADESILYDKLGVKQGCVTAFALINDVAGDVKFIVDSDLLNGKHEYVNFHPLDNAATTRMTVGDFIQFVESTGHSCIPITFD